MAGTATPVRLSPTSKDLGVFRAKWFNLTNEDELGQYQELRTRNNDSSSGVRIERIQQLVRKTQVVSGDGPERTTTTTDELMLLVEWWEKKPIPAQGGNDAEEVADARSSERPAAQE